ncbi:MAG: MGMT family protein, partial [Campylobacterales bacterium]|nr:MGMT family protein [Campylobacterales bacterium]
IPNPIDVYDVIKTIPYGKVMTTTEIRQILAEKYKVDTACPLTTGIFVNICSKANHEFEEKDQKEKIVPTHRVLKKDNELNEKFPEGIEVQKTLLESEGHKIISKGRKKIRYFAKE